MALTSAEHPRPRTGRARRGYWPYVLPMAIGFAVIVAVPFAVNVYYSFFRWKGGLAPLRWTGLGNYIELFGDPIVWRSFANTLYMIGAIVVVPTAFGLLLAAVLFDYIGRRFGDRWANFLRATFYLPQILPIAVAGVLWGWILASRDGAVNSILQAVGIANTPDWLGNPDLAMFSVMVMLSWLQIGYPVVIFMAALQRVDPELYEAAEMDGAGWWRRFGSITIPQIRPDVFIVVLTATVGAMKVFAPILLLTQGGPESTTYVPSYYAYLNFFQYSRVGYGSALATVLSLLILIIASILLIWQRRNARLEEGR